MSANRRRRPNPRLVKMHRNYSVEEAAWTLGVHRNTIRQWIKTGLPTIDDRQPALILGTELRAFLEKRRNERKRPCGPGEMFCLKCRKPKTPAGYMADYLPITETSGNLRGICPDCETLIHRRIAKARIDQECPELDITFPEAASRIRDRNFPSLNSDKRGD